MHCTYCDKNIHKKVKELEEQVLLEKTNKKQDLKKKLDDKVDFFSTHC